MNIKLHIVISILAIFILNYIILIFGDNNIYIVSTLILLFNYIIIYFLFIKKFIYLEKELEKYKEENIVAKQIKKDFIANVSHDLKTPLTSILGFVETLKSEDVKDDETRNRFIDIIYIETKRLKRLIDDILVFSNIDTQVTRNIEKVFLKELLFRIKDILTIQLCNKKIKLHIECEEDMYIKGNRDSIFQIFINLIENALKYGKCQGNIWVNCIKNDNKIKVIVRDDGIGIDREYIPRITERFFRIDKSRTDKIGGTGLGLAIVKHGVKLNEGELFIESELDKGSTFTVVFTDK